MNRLSSTLIDSARNVPSVSVRNSDVDAPAIELPTESPISATDDVDGVTGDDAHGEAGRRECVGAAEVPGLLDGRSCRSSR